MRMGALQRRQNRLDRKAGADADDAARHRGGMRFESSARISPRVFGISSTIMLNQNSATMSSTSSAGQVGNSWKSWLKYSGRIRRDCTASAKADSEHDQPQR